MKNFYFTVAIFISALTFNSCSNESDTPSSLNKSTQEIEVVSLANLQLKSSELEATQEDVSILKFRDNETLLKTISNLEQMTKEERDDWSKQFKGFKSIENIYNEAMEEADSLDFTEQEYSLFKNKYSKLLYFPEYKEDYGAYIPFEKKYLSYIANKDCKYMVGSEIIEFKKIINYNELRISGQALYSIEEDTNRQKSNSEEINILKEVRCNKRKMSARAYMKPSKHPGVGYDIIVEVTFRKKGAFGAWYNYSSETELGWENGQSWKKSGYSSHDYYWAKTGQPFVGKMWVQFRGFGHKCGGEKYYFNVNLK